MKTSTTTSKFFTCLVIILSLTIASVNAQSTDKNINFKNVKVATGTEWIGTSEIAFTKVSLTWEINAAANIDNFEIEFSFDLVNFTSAGTITQEASADEKVKTFTFEHNAPVLNGKTIAQYRIKQTDINGIVTYSEAKIAGLKS